MKSSVIAIVNQKGGVGKTTSAINISAYLSEFGKKVLLIDLDAQANATSGIGLKTNEITHNTYDLIIDKNATEKVLYPSPFDNLHVVPSKNDLAGAEVELVNIVSRETILKKRIEKYKKYYDYIIIDCPPSLGLLTLNALVACDCTIIPVQCEYFALEGIAKLVNTLDLVKENYNEKLEIAGIALTMYDKRTGLNRQVVDNARRFFKGVVFNTIIPRNIRITEAPSHGLPIMLYSPDSQGALAYYELTKEVCERV
ncbi:ParA family protein [Thermoproteota archaeon]